MRHRSTPTSHLLVLASDRPWLCSMVYRQAHQPGREIPCARHPGDPLKPVREHERCAPGANFDALTEDSRPERDNFRARKGSTVIVLLTGRVPQRGFPVLDDHEQGTFRRRHYGNNKTVAID